MYLKMDVMAQEEDLQKCNRRITDSKEERRVATLVALLNCIK